MTTYESMASPATAIVLGDLDNRDPVNGMEALLFQQGSVQTVLHQGAAGSGHTRMKRCDWDLMTP
ncbi:MAG: hypothetical protein U0787_16535 [Polyangia bacterium]